MLLILKEKMQGNEKQQKKRMICTNCYKSFAFLIL